MSDTITQTAALDFRTLTADADYASTLERVSFETGIMVGAETLHAEQDYHRRRLNRHRRFLAGLGESDPSRQDEPERAEPA